ncbi:hypothetical protein [Streptomyces sp. NPDC002676]
MKLNEALQPPSGLGSGRRFYQVGYLPTYAAVFYILLLVWAGARGWKSPAGGHLSTTRAWKTAGSLGVGQTLLLLIGVTLAAVLLAPLQTSLVRLLEGGWPERLGSGWARRRQLARRAKWKRRAELPAIGPVPPPQSHGLPAPTALALPPDTVQRAGVAGSELRRRYPLPDHLVRPTALGNALAAAEDTAGREFGYDAVVAWPRLYPLLGEQTRAIVDDRRDTVDGAARMAATAAVAGVVAAVLLARTGWGLLLALIPLATAWLAYRGAVQAALAYGESLHVAFDLHRFALLRALAADLPGAPADEQRVAAAWCDLWRQGVPMPPGFQYTHDSPASADPPGANQGTTGGQARGQGQ